MGRRDQIDRDAARGKADQEVKEAGGHLDALQTAVAWVIQWSSG